MNIGQKNFFEFYSHAGHGAFASGFGLNSFESCFHYDHLNLEHFEFLEVKETILIIEAGEVTMALEANEVIESFKIGFDNSVQ